MQTSIKSRPGVQTPVLDDFQNLSGIFFSKDKFMIKFHEDLISFPRHMSQVVELVLYLTLFSSYRAVLVILSPLTGGVSS